MCYNYSQYLDKKDLEEEVGKKIIPNDQTGLTSFYNANGFDFPKMPIITSENPDFIQIAEWGFIPKWTFDPEDSKSKQIRSGTLNAKAETIFEKPTWKDSAEDLHCLILTTGFFEPHHAPDGSCIYYFITTKSRKVFSFGGLYKKWINKKTGEERKNFTIITVEPTPMLRRLHNKKPRMPYILGPGEENLWLTRGNNRLDIENLTRTYIDDDLIAWPVSKLANQKQNVPSVIEPIEFSDSLLIAENNWILTGEKPKSEL
ncbi:SOS response-associated peptidase [Pedobacter nutrimenti]|uniref:Abasic site processing protein n=1 Tax=Pedobacter nutrimenti TaxID=1241337 RepID=A0A318U8Y3_9SPHI|nr:SOS response-associated peptidase [Pedobacter nutrimenti]PYF68479.1 putative SOS response-associated peptidase YedK [Pedobacter nutrimenti]